MRIFLALFLGCGALQAIGAQNIAQVLYTKCETPSKTLLQTLQAFGIKHAGAWEEIIAETQKQWLRKNGSERWEVPVVVDKFPERSYTLFTRLQMTTPLHAPLHYYDYAFVLGATVPRVEGRLRFLKEEWARGVRFKKIVFLTGDRPLTAEEREVVAVANETAMMRALFEKMEKPAAWHHLPLIVVDTPQNQGKRPNTKDTFLHFLTANPLPGSVLLISDQPFLGRADTLAHQTLPATFSIETVGEGFSLQQYKENPQALPILLDELARWIFTAKSCT